MFNVKYLIILNICCILFVYFIILFIFYEVVIYKYVCTLNLGTWVLFSTVNIEWLFLYDSLTVVMLFIIINISLCVHVYSYYYMLTDIFLIRFLAYLSLFTFFMLVFVLAGNFVLMFFGWEGVGLTSYLLINFWFTRLNANLAAMKALIINKISDIFLYFALLLIYYYFYTFDYFTIYLLIMYGFQDLTWITFFLLLGAAGKSAQIGLHTWLPDAMEGPTPVSALIHAATMVTAGVFLILRCAPLFEYSKFNLLLMVFLGAFTTIFAGSIGCFQYDIKKIIAYSTCSQLGYLFLTCGLSQYSLSFFHLFNHAFFKALLFLGAGSIIHSIYNEQDIRKMGGLIFILPVTSITFFIASLTLMGFPFYSGFYSKDLIIEIFFFSFIIKSYFFYWLVLMSAWFTTFYTIRLFLYVFLLEPNFNFLITYEHDIINIILIILAIYSIYIGFVFYDLFLGFGTDIWYNYFSMDINYVIEYNLFSYKLLIIICMINSSLVTYFLYIDFKEFNTIYLFNFINKRWYFDIIYNKFLVYKSLYLSYTLVLKLIDKGFIEYFIILILNALKQCIKFINSLYNGILYHYFLLTLIILIFNCIILCVQFNFFDLFIFIYLLYLFFYDKIK